MAQDAGTDLFCIAFKNALTKAWQVLKINEVIGVDVVHHCLDEQICPRCILRLFGHPISDDYCLPPSNQSAIRRNLIACNQTVNDSQGTAEATGSQQGSIPGSTVRTSSKRICRMCLGILQLIDGSVSVGNNTPDVESQPPNTIQQSTTETSEAGPAAVTAQDGLDTGMVVDGSNPANMSSEEQTAGGTTPTTTVQAKPLSDARPETLSAMIQALNVAYETFGIEITIPATTACREHALFHHLKAKFGQENALGSWNVKDITKLKAVAQRMLRSSLVQQLQKQYTEPQQADLSLQLMFEHPDSHQEHVMLAKDFLSTRQRQQQGKHGGRGPYPKRSGGRVASQRGRGHHANNSDYELRQAIESLNVERANTYLLDSPAQHVEGLLTWPPEGATTAARPTIKFHRAPLLLAGRYLKLRRNVPQTCWIDSSTGQRIGNVSAAERIEAVVLPLYGAATTKFISGGREDSDVRMLGDGRPFVLEIIQPQRSHPEAAALRKIEEQLQQEDHGVQVKGFTPCTKQAIERIKEAEETKEKTYQALCWCSRAITQVEIERLLAVQNRKIMQDTPVRVLHRRASKIRDKHVTVEEVNVLEGKPNYFTVKLRTQAGTYIKEFCHGDWGRTCPSVADIIGGGVRVEILQLDVLAVHMDNWP